MSPEKARRGDQTYSVHSHNEASQLSRVVSEEVEEEVKTLTLDGNNLPLSPGGN